MYGNILDLQQKERNILVPQVDHRPVRQKKILNVVAKRNINVHLRTVALGVVDHLHREKVIQIVVYNVN